MTEQQKIAFYQQHQKISKELLKKGANHKQLAIDALRLCSRAINEATIIAEE